MLPRRGHEARGVHIGIGLDVHQLLDFRIDSLNLKHADIVCLPLRQYVLFKQHLVVSEVAVGEIIVKSPYHMTLYRLYVYIYIERDIDIDIDIDIDR